MYPLTKNRPKPLLEAGGRPIIDYIIDKLDSLAPVNEIIVVTNSKFAAHFRNWRRRVKAGKPISIIDDQTKSNSARLGAVGDINLVVDRRKIKEGLLVFGGDNLFEEGLEDFLEFSREHKDSPVIAAYNIGRRQEAGKYGVVGINRLKRVVDFQEKPAHPKSTLVGMCLYYFPAGSLGLIKEYLDSVNKIPDTTGSYIDWLRKKTKVYVFVFGGRWYDIGDLKFYRKVRDNFGKTEEGSWERASISLLQSR